MSEAVQKISNKFIELPFGYQDQETPELIHRAVTFGRRSTGGDVISASDAANGSDLQYTLEMIGRAITKFGGMKLPVPMTVLLSLDEIDRRELRGAYFEFLSLTAENVNQASEEIKSEKAAVGTARLQFGFERDGVIFTTVEFGKRLTGYDEIKIESEAKSESEENVLKRAFRVSKISTADGAKSIEGAMTLDEMKSLDVADFILLQEAGEEWLNSFRKR